MSLMSSNTYATLNGTHARSLLNTLASKHLPFVKTVSCLDNLISCLEECRPVCDHSGLVVSIVPDFNANVGEFVAIMSKQNSLEIKILVSYLMRLSKP